jgi:epoxide hydrolase
MASPDDEISSFRIDIPQEDLNNLHERLSRTRWAQDLPGTGWDYGVPAGYLRELAEYWRDGFDWRAVEAELNKFPQFTTVIDGQRVHFLHVRSPEPNAVPLLLSHGWPGTVLEYTGIIKALTDPRAVHADPALAFDVIVPSMPGFGFSGPTHEPGWDGVRTAHAWAALMNRLGYETYGAAGNDWGGVVTQVLGQIDPGHVLGMHLTQLLTFPDETVDPATLSAAEQSTLSELSQWQQTRAAYYSLQSYQPQTVAHALTDSPAGLLGWFSQILGPELDRDFVVANAAIHWLTDTVASGMRIYYEAAHNPLPEGNIDVPLAVAQFHEQFRGIRRFANEFAAIVSWNSYDEPGHYAARQYPELFLADLRRFFATVRDRHGLIPR